jgi:two-component system, NarL family, sensor kinase
MKGPRRRPAPRVAASAEVLELRVRLADAEATLRAIRVGEVDAVMSAGVRGAQVFTLEGAEHAYRVLIESMNEGALTLTVDKTILYANECFARMVRSPLEEVTGGSFRRFLSAADRASLKRILRRTRKTGSKIQVLLLAADGSRVPVQISIRPLARNGFTQRVLGMVVTDLTEVRRNEDVMRALTQRVLQVQEAERGRVAVELDENVTQLLCAVVIRSQALADTLSTSETPLKKAALALREMLGGAAEEVERLARNLRPGVLNHLGLVAVLRDTSREFEDRTSVPVKLALVKLVGRLPAETELTLYRILQEALRNVEQHARAQNVTVRLRKRGGSIQLTIDDDGVGFDPNRTAIGREGNGGLGLLGMRERATYVGGSLEVTSTRRLGTGIQVTIPLAPRMASAS